MADRRADEGLADPKTLPGPKLGIPAFGFQSWYEARAPCLKNIHVQNPAGFVSCGFPVGDAPSMKRGVAEVVSRIGRDLFFADFSDHERRINADVTPEFSQDLYAPAVWRASTPAS